MQTTTPTKSALKPGIPGGDTKPWYAYRWPWLVMLGPIVAIVAGTHLAWVAFSSQDALVVDDYYKQGKAINQDLRRAAQATLLRMSLRLNYNAAEGKLNGTIESGAGSTGQEIQLHLIHPTLPQNDMHFKARTDAAGHFEIALPMLQLGHWQIQAEDQQRNWRLSGAWAWPQQRQIIIKADPESAESAG